jgi:transmembrane sensor
MVSSEDIQCRAADWLARLDRPDAPAAEHEAFEAWCRADPRHLAAYLRLLELWNRLDALKVLPDAMLSDAALAAARAPDVAPSASEQPRHDRRFFLPVALAAGVLAIAVGLAWWRWSGPLGLAIGAQRYSTMLGGFEQVRLADGSIVQLNTDSEVAVRLRSRERDITLLRGEATFEAAPDRLRPFIVVAGSTAVRAVGTVFNVERAGTSVEVLVTKGVVAVGPPQDVAAHGGAPEMVDAGQMAIAAPSQVKVESLDQEEIARRLAWHEGMLLFNGQSLAEVAAEFNRYNERKLVIADPDVGRVRVGGYFRATDLDSFVRVLQERFGIIAVREPGRTLLRR